MEYRDELAIAKKAEKMLTSALQSKTQSFADHYHRKEGDKSLKQAFSKARVKRYGKKKDGNQKIFMRTLTIRMAKHGFVQHYGVDTIREGGDRKRTKPKAKTYHFGAHYYKMKATPFIDEAIRQSGVIDFVMENVGQLRANNFAEELVFPLGQFSK
ncbi:MAG: hypothetical protein Q4A00_04000 [Flavobacteriaceae bacterium]|nr:hypothetical protein [Flavobacteriaceae bacterium]